MVFLNHVTNGTTKVCIDHINNIKKDNRVLNLQLISNRQNLIKDKKSKGSSKYLGVSWSKQNKKWESSICIYGKRTFLGGFISELDASKAYQKALIELEPTKERRPV